MGRVSRVCCVGACAAALAAWSGWRVPGHCPVDNTQHNTHLGECQHDRVACLPVLCAPPCCRRHACLHTRAQVCREGQALDPNQVALLRVFGVKMATFRITPLAWWSDGGEAWTPCPWRACTRQPPWCRAAGLQCQPRVRAPWCCHMLIWVLCVFTRALAGEVFEELAAYDGADEDDGDGEAAGGGGDGEQDMLSDDVQQQQQQGQQEQGQQGAADGEQQQQQQAAAADTRAGAGGGACGA